jgi:hypothetical protein
MAMPELRGPGAYQLEPGVVALAEQHVTGGADAGEMRWTPQLQHVGQVVRDERPRDRAEAMHEDVAALLPELARLLHQVTLDHRRVGPVGLAEGVETTYFRMLLILPGTRRTLRPGGGVRLVGAAAHEQGLTGQEAALRDLVRPPRPCTRSARPACD